MVKNLLLFISILSSCYYLVFGINLGNLNDTLNINNDPNVIGNASNAANLLNNILGGNAQSLNILSNALNGLSPSALNFLTSVAGVTDPTQLLQQFNLLDLTSQTQLLGALLNLVSLANQGLITINVVGLNLGANPISVIGVNVGLTSTNIIGINLSLAGLPADLILNLLTSLLGLGGGLGGLTSLLGGLSPTELAGLSQLLSTGGALPSGLNIPTGK